MTHTTAFLRRRQLLGLMALSATHSLHAQDAWPSRPITLIHPYAPGGSADALARLLGRQLEARLKQTVVVEGRPGGAATIATAHVARARPDGYTLLLGTSAGHVVTPLMQRIAYDGIGDFRFIGVAASQPNVLIAHPGLGVDSLQALIALARKEPGRLNYGSAGMGGATHLGAEAFAQAAQIKLTHVPYNGAPPAIKDLLGGQVQLGMLNHSAVNPFIADGRVKALAYGGAQRTLCCPMCPPWPNSAMATPPRPPGTRWRRPRARLTAWWKPCAAPWPWPPPILRMSRPWPPRGVSVSTCRHRTPPPLCSRTSWP